MPPILRKGDLLCRWSWRWLFGRCRRREQIRSCLLSAVTFHGGDHGATGFCKQLVAIDSHRTMPPARQAHVECGLLNVRVVVANTDHMHLRSFAHSAMPRNYLIFGDIEGKLDML